MSDEMLNPAIIVLGPSALPVAREVAGLLEGEIHGLASRVEGVDVSFDKAGDHLRGLFGAKRPIIAIMASGALLRCLAPVLDDKQTEPPVLAVAEDASSIVPMVGGHHRGNMLARLLANHLGGHAAITTAGDLRFGLALDEPPAGWVLAEPERAKSVMARLLAGEEIRLEGIGAAHAKWLYESSLPFDDDAPLAIRVSHLTCDPHEDRLHIVPRDLVVGLGCERHCDAAQIIALVEEGFAASGLSTKAIGAFVSIDLKADEAALHAVARHFGAPLGFFTADELEAETPRLANPSDTVFAEVGCHGVSEGAALAAAGAKGTLLVEKRKSARATMAVTSTQAGPIVGTPGRKRGTLAVVGIGPGMADWRSPEVSQLVSRATDLVGYSLYLDLLEGLAEGKTRHDFDLGKEEDRVRHAMELAGEGRDVALVCSGDAGIYAMATLVFELLAEGGLSDAASRIAIHVSPGISALQAAAARAGAPLGHDFCTISLSDLLTPWPDIRRRVKAAAEGDFVIAFYNPVSRRRRTQLAHARDVLLQHRPADTPVILATNLGREGEAVRVVPLAELNIDDVDMLTVVIVGSSDTRTVETGEGRTWVYTPRGYAAKDGTQIGSGA
ncbi:MAG: precorrin-3B C(17)-methyltransferase [Pseudomonadota bacterium]